MIIYIYIYNPRRVLTNKMGGVEPETNIIWLDFFFKNLLHTDFSYLEFLDFSLGLLILQISPVISDWWLSQLLEFDPTLDTMNQLVTFEMIDSKIFEDPHFLGCLQGQWKTLSLDTIDFFLCEIFVLYYRCLLFIRAWPGHGCECDDGRDICILYWICFFFIGYGFQINNFQILGCPDPKPWGPLTVGDVFFADMAEKILHEYLQI